MSAFNKSILSACAQGESAQTSKMSVPELRLVHDLQAHKLGKRFALTPEMARIIADLAFNAGARS